MYFFLISNIYCKQFLARLLLLIFHKKCSAASTTAQKTFEKRIRTISHAAARTLRSKRNWLVVQSRLSTIQTIVINEDYFIDNARY